MEQEAHLLKLYKYNLESAKVHDDLTLSQYNSVNFQM